MAKGNWNLRSHVLSLPPGIDRKSHKYSGTVELNFAPPPGPNTNVTNYGEQGSQLFEACWRMFDADAATLALLIPVSSWNQRTSARNHQLDAIAVVLLRLPNRPMFAAVVQLSMQRRL